MNKKDEFPDRIPKFLFRACAKLDRFKPKKHLLKSITFALVEEIGLISPIQRIEDSILDKKGISLFIKRDDLIHPKVQGNKWRKMKYNMEAAIDTKHSALLTFGGYYSNHIYATAAAANMFGLKSIGVIRGEKPIALGPTLRFAQTSGMQLKFISRADYKLKDSPTFVEKLRDEFGDFYLVPEGGTNLLALKGVAEIVDEIDIEYDLICTSVGTGGTLAGLTAGLKGKKEVIGFSSLKGDDTLTNKVHDLAKEHSNQSFGNYTINFDYHFGGYAKVNPELISFIKNFKQKYDIQLEPVYTGKMLFGLFDMIKNDCFPKGFKIIALHTGGLQGLHGFKSYFSESELAGLA